MLERQHAAEAAGHLPLRQRMLRMRRQAGVIDPLDGRVPLQEAGHGQARCGCGRPCAAHRSAARGAAARPRTGAAPARRCADSPTPASMRARLPSDHPRRHVGVPVQVLGRAVDHQIIAQVQGPLVVRRGEGIVGDGQRARPRGRSPPWPAGRSGPSSGWSASRCRPPSCSGAWRGRRPPCRSGPPGSPPRHSAATCLVSSDSAAV